MKSVRPSYDLRNGGMLEQRRPLARGFAAQVLETAKPFLPRPIEHLHVLDVGCGYGYTSLELAQLCERVVGIEPSRHLYEHAASLGQTASLPNLQFRPESIEEMTDKACYDLVVLDNVLEHLPDQPMALRRICESLKPKGVTFIVVPNKLWPIEVHYGLPFLSYLPLPLANAYLRVTGRGQDYTDASYAPTYSRLNGLLRECRELSCQYVLPADLALTTLGNCMHYRFGVALLRRCRWLWPLAKVFLVIGVKR